MTSSLTFRKATPEDASFIARHVLEALHWGMYVLPLTDKKQKAWQELTSVCRLADTLYSYENAIIAMADQQPAGLIVAYDGQRYRSMRKNTFSRLTAFDGQNVETMADETRAGEFYIDSLAVNPKFRGKGVGRSLLLAAIEEADRREMPAALLVAPDNPQAQRLYASVGFRQDGEVFAFGENYLHMTR